MVLSLEMPMCMTGCRSCDWQKNWSFSNSSKSYLVKYELTMMDVLKVSDSNLPFTCMTLYISSI